MKNRDLLLAIDNGTQSMKALVFDAKGYLVAKHIVPFEPPYVSKHPGWAEQDAHVFWQALCQACRGLWNEKDIDKERIAGVAITTQRSTLFNMDKNGNPLRPAIHWLDLQADSLERYHRLLSGRG
jgi:sugar (pentulose or hexulose) kinase